MILRFIKYYKPHLGLFIFDMVCAVVLSLCNLFYPQVVKSITGDLVYRESITPIIIAGAILLGVYILKMICTYCVGYYGHLVGVRMQEDMRRDLFNKYQSLPFSYFDNHKTGDLMSRLTNDLMDISELAHHGPENLFLAILMFVGSFIMLASINIQLTLIMFAIVPFIILFAILSRRSMSQVMKNTRKQTAVLNTTLENAIGGVRETKAYAGEEYEIGRFGFVNRMLAMFRGQTMQSIGRFEAVMGFMSDFLYFVVIFIGGLFLKFGYISSDDFIAFLLYIAMFLNPINRFVALFQQLQEGMSGFSRFVEIMDEPIEEDKGTINIGDIRGDVVFDNVTFTYGEENSENRPVISGLSLRIGAGETVALVGPSGGGKTTLCNLIPRFYSIKSGSITVDGVDVRDITLSSLRSGIGIVSQSVFLFDGTVRENIAYSNPDATDEEVIEAAKRANIHEFITTLDEGYDTQVGERGVKLSGGQRQRIAIARVFMKNPKLLILDEATSALDNATEMQIQAALEELSKGRTVIVVAHRLSTVKNADRIVVLGPEGIIEQGTHTELIALDGEYKKLYTYQFKE